MVTHDQVLQAADHVRAVVLGDMSPMGDATVTTVTKPTPPASAYRRSARGRKAWLDKAAKTLEASTMVDADFLSGASANGATRDFSPRRHKSAEGSK